jgi:hypothetical protein
MTPIQRNETSSEIEREAEASRARLARTLDQLRDNLTPQHIADELLGSARDGAASLLESVGRTAAESPLPALLIGAACAMFVARAKGSAPLPPVDLPATPDALAATAGDKPSPRPEAPPPVGKGPWAVLAERPLVTALAGLAIGWAVAALLPRAKTNEAPVEEKRDALAAE